MQDLKLGQPDTIDYLANTLWQVPTGMEFGPSGGLIPLINDFDWLQEQFDNQENITYYKEDLNLDSYIVDMLDRFELLYGDKVENPRMYNSNDLIWYI